MPYYAKSTPIKPRPGDLFREDRAFRQKLRDLQVKDQEKVKANLAAGYALNRRHIEAMIRGNKEQEKIQPEHDLARAFLAAGSLLAIIHGDAEKDPTPRPQHQSNLHELQRREAAFKRTPITPEPVVEPEAQPYTFVQKKGSITFLPVPEAPVSEKKCEALCCAPLEHFDKYKGDCIICDDCGNAVYSHIDRLCYTCREFADN